MGWSGAGCISLLSLDGKEEEHPEGEAGTDAAAFEVKATGRGGGGGIGTIGSSAVFFNNSGG